MNNVFLKAILFAASICSALCLISASVNAENVYLNGYYPIPPEPTTGLINKTIMETGFGPYTPTDNLKTFPFRSAVPPELTEINEKIFGGAIGMSDGRTSSWITLPAQRKRAYVYTFLRQDTSKNFVGIQPFQSKDEAKGLCDGLSETLKATYSVYFYGEKPSQFTNLVSEYLYTGTPQVYLSDWGGGVQKVIAVAYNIAYDTGSTEQADDGKSTPAVRHHFCANPWNWEPSSYWGGSSEDEFKGIRKSRLTDAGYEVTCMDSEKYPTTTFVPHESLKNFWTNGKQDIEFRADRMTEHQFNAQLGARYCHVN